MVNCPRCAHENLTTLHLILHAVDQHQMELVAAMRFATDALASRLEAVEKMRIAHREQKKEAA